MNKQILLKLLTGALLGATTLCRLQAQPAAPTGASSTAATETKEQRDARMKWWREARFGMFIHWGIYSVPAGVYQGRNIGGLGEWIQNTAKIPSAEYRKYADQFNPTNFNADDFVKVVKDAGMKYIVITAKHHDGFAMFKTDNPFNIVDATPFKRDVIKELSEAARKQGIHFGVYYSQRQDWNHPGGDVQGSGRGGSSPAFASSKRRSGCPVCGRLRSFLDDVALEGGGVHDVEEDVGFEHGEAIVVLGSDDDVPHTGILDRLTKSSALKFVGSIGPAGPCGIRRRESRQCSESITPRPPILRPGKRRRGRDEIPQWMNMPKRASRHHFMRAWRSSFVSVAAVENAPVGAAGWACSLQGWLRPNTVRSFRNICLL